MKKLAYLSVMLKVTTITKISKAKVKRFVLQDYDIGLVSKIYVSSFYEETRLWNLIYLRVYRQSGVSNDDELNRFLLAHYIPYQVTICFAALQ